MAGVIKESRHDNEWIMLDREIQYFDEPFRYAIIDNFFNQEDLEFVSNYITLDI